MQSKEIEVTFYHFTLTSLVSGVSRLIKKIYDSGQNLLVVCRTEEEMNQLDKALWTFSQKDFIPHAMSHEENFQPHINPVLLAIDAHDNKNHSQLVLNLSCLSLESSPFEKHLYAFYGNEEELQDIFERYNQYKSRPDIASLAFWKQDQDGKWIKK